MKEQWITLARLRFSDSDLCGDLSGLCDRRSEPLIRRSPRGYCNRLNQRRPIYSKKSRAVVGDPVLGKKILYAPFKSDTAKPCRFGQIHGPKKRQAPPSKAVYNSPWNHQKQPHSAICEQMCSWV